MNLVELELMSADDLWKLRVEIGVAVRVGQKDGRF